jgi:hypothetical protein
LDKLLSFEGNKYVLAKAAMYAIEKVTNMKGYDEEQKGKTAINILEMVLNKRINYILEKEESE